MISSEMTQVDNIKAQEDIIAEKILKRAEIARITRQLKSKLFKAGLKVRESQGKLPSPSKTPQKESNVISDTNTNINANTISTTTTPKSTRITLVEPGSRSIQKRTSPYKQPRSNYTTPLKRKQTLDSDETYIENSSPVKRLHSNIPSSPFCSQNSPLTQRTYSQHSQLSQKTSPLSAQTTAVTPQIPPKTPPANNKFAALAKTPTSTSNTTAKSEASQALQNALFCTPKTSASITNRLKDFRTPNNSNSSNGQGAKYTNDKEEGADLLLYMSNSPARTTTTARETRDYNQLYMNILQTPKPVGHLVSSNGSTSNDHHRDPDVSVPSINVDSTAITTTPPSSAARPPQISFGSVTPSVFNGTNSNRMMIGTPSGGSLRNGTGANANGTLAIAMPTTPNSANMLPIPESLLLNTPNQSTSNSGNAIPTSNPTNIKPVIFNNSQSKSSSSSTSSTTTTSSSSSSSASSSATKSTTSTSSTSTTSTSTTNPPQQRFPQQQTIATPATPKNNNSRFFNRNQLDKTPGFSMSDYVNIFTPSPRLTKTPDFNQIQFQNLNLNQFQGQGQTQGQVGGQGQGHFMGGVVKPVVLMYSNGNNGIGNGGDSGNSLNGILSMGVNGNGNVNGQGSRNVSGNGARNGFGNGSNLKR
ncbi:unnamed protein product [Ambrosiozyma monospora]|uniref:Unnamed protein product n=1 Tax=Ambrosiozyma monospora TaxID=43982 RepID=A0A9W6Z0D8_AMBMO|nr:unnamed protein product [Ambrosiozyma monospora]